MEERHRARAGQAAAERTGPERTEPQEPPQTAEQAAEVVRGVFGDSIQWETTFRTMTGHEGETIYVDERTGQVYDSIPNLHPTDGRPV